MSISELRMTPISNSVYTN